MGRGVRCEYCNQTYIRKNLKVFIPYSDTYIQKIIKVFTPNTSLKILENIVPIEIRYLF